MREFLRSLDPLSVYLWVSALVTALITIASVVGGVAVVRILDPRIRRLAIVMLWRTDFRKYRSELLQIGGLTVAWVVIAGFRFNWF
jgi:hypothetical protein